MLVLVPWQLPCSYLSKKAVCLAFMLNTWVYSKMPNGFWAGSSCLFMTCFSSLCTLENFYFMYSGGKKKSGCKIWCYILLPEFELNQWLRKKFLPSCWCRLVVHQWILSFVNKKNSKCKVFGGGGKLLVCNNNISLSHSLKYNLNRVQSQQSPVNSFSLIRIFASETGWIKFVLKIQHVCTCFFLNREEFAVREPQDSFITAMQMLGSRWKSSMFILFTISQMQAYLLTWSWFQLYFFLIGWVSQKPFFCSLLIRNGSSFLLLEAPSVVPTTCFQVSEVTTINNFSKVVIVF